MGKFIRNGIPYGGSAPVDSTLDTTSMNPVANKPVAEAINEINADLSAKALVNTYYDATAKKLYLVNADGTKGSEISLNAIPKYVVNCMGYGTVYSGKLFHTISNNVTKVHAEIEGAISNSNVNTSYLTVQDNAGYNTTYTMVKDALYYPNNDPVPVVLKAGDSVTVGYAAATTVALEGTFCWY